MKRLLFFVIQDTKCYRQSTKDRPCWQISEGNANGGQESWYDITYRLIKLRGICLQKVCQYFIQGGRRPMCRAHRVYAISD